MFGPGVDEPVARITAAGTVVWYLLDYQNSVIGMVDSTGSSLGSVTYDGFGNVLTNTTGVNGDRYGFTSRELDSATGQQYNWARYYDPALGKWTSMDPLGFEAGDANLYRYVGNGPTNGVDPQGTDEFWLNSPWKTAKIIFAPIQDFFDPKPSHPATNVARKKILASASAMYQHDQQDPNGSTATWNGETPSEAYPRIAGNALFPHHVDYGGNADHHPPPVGTIKPPPAYLVIGGPPTSNTGLIWYLISAAGGFVGSNPGNIGRPGGPPGMPRPEPKPPAIIGAPPNLSPDRGS